MNKHTCIVSVTDPSRSTLILAQHSGLSMREARYLASIYRALGYSQDHVRITMVA